MLSPVHVPIQLSSGRQLDEIRETDLPQYLEHLQDRQIYEQTLNIPFPYTEADAQTWLAILSDERAKLGLNLNWAIRDADGKLIGGIGLRGFTPGKGHVAEIGYWLARPWWNQGIMTEAAREVTRIGHEHFGLERITAHVFAFNEGSCRVLEKAGYEFEGRLHKHYLKDGKIFDGLLFAKVRGSLQALGHPEFGRDVRLSVIGAVCNNVERDRDGAWGDIQSTLRLDPAIFSPTASRGLEEFSHIEVSFLFDRVPSREICRGDRRPRGNPNWPSVGILAQRGSPRPNRIGHTVCQLVSVQGLEIVVSGLDAWNGTPILDIKPSMVEFGTRGASRQPNWVGELMQGYW